MTLLKPILSSSKANLYEVSDGRTRILLECGCTYKQLQTLCGFHAASNYAGCLITHEHSDHSKAAMQLAKRGVAIYATPGTLEALRLNERHYRTHPVEYNTPVKLGSFQILAFPTVHNAAQPCGWVITSSRSGESLVFATDTYRIGYKFEGASEVAVECNFAKDLISDELPETVRRRIEHSHMSLEACRDFLLAQDLTTVRRVWLVHLSRERASAERFRRFIEDATGVRTLVAEA